MKNKNNLLEVLILTLDFPPNIGGIQDWTYSFCKYLRDAKVHIIAPFDKGCRDFDRQQPYRITRIRPLLPSKKWTILCSFVYQLIKNVISNKVNLIICAHPFVSPCAFAAKIFFKIPYVVLAFGMELNNEVFKRFGIIGLKYADLIFVISEFTRQEVLKSGVMYKKILKFPVPVDLARWDIADGNYNILEKYKLAGKHILLTVARLKERYKGHDKVIKSLALILAKIPDVYYIIVGSGPLRPYLEALAMACGVHDKVLFLGSISDADLKVLYNACDVFIMASRNRLIDGGAEGFGLAFLEANYFEKPVIGGNSGGIPDAVIDGVTGILINPEDEKEIAEAVVKLLLDKELAKRLGSNGRERVRGEFTWEKVINRMSGALREVVKNSN